MGQFVKVATTAEMQNAPSARLAEVNGQPIAVFHVEGAYYATDDLCPHRGGSLSQGMLTGYEVSCPWHGARFDIRTGEVQCPPAAHGVKCYPVRVTGPDIEVEV
jgi:nitrite reductase/ring-hydroxylating ferredoxin subunit